MEQVAIAFDQLVNTVCGEWSDPHFASVTWGCHFEGADGGTAFTDVKGATGTASFAPPTRAFSDY